MKLSLFVTFIIFEEIDNEWLRLRSRFKFDAESETWRVKVDIFPIRACCVWARLSGGRRWGRVWAWSLMRPRVPRLGLSNCLDRSWWGKWCVFSDKVTLGGVSETESDGEERERERKIDIVVYPWTTGGRHRHNEFWHFN